MRHLIYSLILCATFTVVARPQCGPTGTLIYNPVSQQFDCTGLAAATTPAFSAITAGTNATALVVGTGGSLTTSGSGTINATSLGGTVAAGYQTLLSSSNKLGLAAGGTNADLSGTGGTSQFLKQATAGAAITVVRPACADLSDAGSGCSATATAPGGSTTELQYRAGASTFGGITSWKLDTTNHTIGATSVADPTVDPTATLAGAGAGNIDNGNHCYAYVFGVAGGGGFTGQSIGITYPSNYSNTLTVVDKTLDGKATITIPVSSDTRVTSRVLFRSKAGETCQVSNMFLLATIANNSATTYTDNIADSSLTDKTSGFAYYNGANATSAITNNGLPAVYLGDGELMLQDYAFMGSIPGILYVQSNGGGRVLNSIGTAGALTNDGSGGLSWQSGGLTTVAFASLGTPANGFAYYCSDCKPTSGSDATAVASGTGCHVVRTNGAWITGECN